MIQDQAVLIQILQKRKLMRLVSKILIGLLKIMLVILENVQLRLLLMLIGQLLLVVLLLILVVKKVIITGI